MERLIYLLKKMDIVYNEPVVLKSGEISDFYVDIKKAYGDPETLELISGLLWEKAKTKKPAVIAASGYGGLPPATIISSKQNLHLTLVRDNPKNHGKKGWMDGYVPKKGDKIAIIDDVFTTGKSLKKMIEVLGQTGATIVGCYVVVKRGDGELDIPLEYLLLTDDIINQPK